MTINEKFVAFAIATNNELFDTDYKGGEWMTENVETRETLEQWAESCKKWNECTATKSGTIAGFPFLAWTKAQVTPGQPRLSMSVVDFGELRIALPGTDLTYFS